MTVPTTVMMDTEAGDAHNIPIETTHVGGYVSGTPDIKWTGQEWDMFPSSVRIRIEQGYGALPNPGDYDELDCERGALSPQTVAGLIAARVAAGYEWTTVYASRANLALVATAVQAHGDAVWVGHVNCMLADWNLDQAEAEALVGTSVEGMYCIGVQWASPSSNPHTLIPGTSMTLIDGNVDLAVVEAGWTPSTLPPPAVVPPSPAVVFHGIVTYLLSNGTLNAASVTSTDLRTWQ